MFGFDFNGNRFVETLQSLPIIGLYYTITADCIYVNLENEISRLDRRGWNVIEENWDCHGFNRISTEGYSRALSDTGGTPDCQYWE